ncbi:hypothetical protein M433DRAFT_536252 [Acidomyces richmondensis BFW]|nr:hypothetical protein M433DRAFT_536252 [Acidomyces richmondensis BFW]
MRNQSVRLNPDGIEIRPTKGRGLTQIQRSCQPSSHSSICLRKFAARSTATRSSKLSQSSLVVVASRLCSLLRVASDTKACCCSMSWTTSNSTFDTRSTSSGVLQRCTEHITCIDCFMSYTCAGHAKGSGSSIKDRSIPSHTGATSPTRQI